MDFLKWFLIILIILLAVSGLGGAYVLWEANDRLAQKIEPKTIIATCAPEIISTTTTEYITATTTEYYPGYVKEDCPPCIQNCDIKLNELEEEKNAKIESLNAEIENLNNIIEMLKNDVGTK